MGRGSSPFLDKKHRGRVRGPLRELEALLSEQVKSGTFNMILFSTS